MCNPRNIYICLIQEKNTNAYIDITSYNEKAQNNLRKQLILIQSPKKNFKIVNIDNEFSNIWLQLIGTIVFYDIERLTAKAQLKNTEKYTVKIVGWFVSWAETLKYIFDERKEEKTKLFMRGSINILSVVAQPG